MRQDVSLVIKDIDDLSSLEKTLEYNWERFHLNGVSRKIRGHSFIHHGIAV